MAKQALVVGLGRFGVAVAQALMDRGVEVLVADLSDERVRSISDSVTEAVVLDATDEEALGRTAPDRRDLCICALGDGSIRASILCTALLREMGAKRVVARASDPLHGRILRRVGAHEVVDPLRDFGARFATHLMHENILGELPLGRDLVITEMRPDDSMVEKTLAELELPEKAGITVIGNRASGGDVERPDPERKIEKQDVLIVVSEPGAVAAWMEGEKE